MVRFKSVLTPDARGGGGTLVRIPNHVAVELGLKGMPKINAVIAGTPYRGSLMPMGDGTYCLGVPRSIQEAAGVGQGDSITIDIELDIAPRTVGIPIDLAQAMEGDQTAGAAWEALSYTEKKEMAGSLYGAKRRETRERRLAQALETLRKPR